MAVPYAFAEAFLRSACQRRLTLLTLLTSLTLLTGWCSAGTIVNEVNKVNLVNMVSLAPSRGLSLLLSTKATKLPTKLATKLVSMAHSYCLLPTATAYCYCRRPAGQRRY